MKALKMIVGALVAIILIVPLFLSPDVNVSRYKVMKASPEIIFPYLNNLEKMQDWGPWHKHDPSIEITYGDKKEGEGASYSSSGENTPSITSTISKSTPYTAVDVDLVFEGQGGSTGNYLLEETEEGTKVTWTFDSKMDGLWLKRWMGIMMRKGSSEFMEEGLGYLQEIVEEEAANPAPAATTGYEVQEIDYPEQQFLTHREKISMADITAFYTEHFGAIAGMVGDKMAGMPCGLYYDFNMETGEADLAAAIPVTEAIDGNDDYELIALPGRKALLIDYYGPYEGSGAAHEAMDAYMKENGYVQADLPVIEQYANDPTTVSDPSEILTKVFYFADKE